MLTSVKDKNGKEWFINVTLAAIYRFENRTGKGLYKEFFDLIIDVGIDNLDKGLAAEKFLEIASKLFGKVSTLCCFLFETCETGKLELEEFLELFTKEEIPDAMMYAIAAIFESLPHKGDTEEIPSAGGDEGKQEKEEDLAKISGLGNTSQKWPDQSE